QLIGIELQPAEPAQAELTFPLVAAPATPAVVLVPERSQISADPGDGGPPLIFETVRGLKALRARLDSILVLDGGSYVEVASSDATVQAFKPFGPAVQDGAEFALGFNDPGPDPLPEDELDLAITVTQDSLRALYLQCGIGSTPAFPPAKLRWEVWNG